MAQQVKTRETKPAAKPVQKEPATRNTAPGLFTRDNLLWMIGGGVVMAIGYLLMSGGASKDPNVFDYNQVYSPVRITVAPILILIGLAIEVYALFREPKKG